MSLALIARTLRQAASARQCLLCAVQREAEEHYLWFWAHEGTNDGAAIGKLHQSRGFCARHARQAGHAYEREWGDGLGIANTYEYLLARLSTDLAELSLPKNAARHREARQGRRRAVEERLGAQAPCPACASADNAVRSAARALLKELENDAAGNDWRALYRESAGLCLPHVRLALELSGYPRAAEFLLTAERESVGALLDDVREYIRKCDYRFRDEPKGAEQDSWIRALAKYAGILEPTDGRCRCADPLPGRGDAAAQGGANSPSPNKGDSYERKDRVRTSH